MKRMHVHREGRNIILGLVLLIFIINVPMFLHTPHWAFAITLVLSAALLVFVTYFFRNPVRVLEVDDPSLVVAPADGRIVVIEEVDETEMLHRKCLQVSIFMSPFNVHANWYPVEGQVLLSAHQSGRHKGAWLPKSSTENERSAILIETKDGQQILVRQVAGALARRIVTYAKAGKQSHRNEHLGFIKFGSRVDMYLPVGTDVFVDFGDLVRGNETVIARLPESEKGEKDEEM